MPCPSVGLIAVAAVIWTYSRSLPILAVCVLLAILTAAGTRQMNARKIAELRRILAQGHLG